MQNNLTSEKCVLCGAGAAVRITGTSFCSSCGLQQHAGGTPPVASVARSRRAAMLGILSSGFLLKMLMGAVALAAVSGVAASLQSVPVAAEADSGSVVTASTVLAGTSTTQVRSGTLVDTGTTVVATGPEQGPTEAAPTLVDSPDRVTAALQYAAVVQAWANCVATAVSDHSGDQIDPSGACGDVPQPGDFGIAGHDEDGPGNSENAPGHDEDGPGNSENAPGHGNDKPPKDKDK